MKTFKVVVAGGRKFDDYDTLRLTLDNLLEDKLKTHKVVIISGKARGADTLGEWYAKGLGLEVLEFPAEWEKYGRSAGHRRNAEMCSECDALCAFWDGRSAGTNSMIDMAKKAGKIVHVEEY